MTEAIHTGARRIRDGELIDEKTLAVEKRMKRQAVQDGVRNDNQMRRVQPIAYGRDERPVELAEMGLGRGVKLIGEQVHVTGLQAELRQLKLQQRDQFANAGGVAERDDFELIA